MFIVACCVQAVAVAARGPILNIQSDYYFTLSWALDSKDIVDGFFYLSPEAHQ